MQTNQPKKRGRPVGSKSFVNVSMSDLISRFGETQSIPVSRVWLRNLGIEIEQKAEVDVISPAAKPTADTKIEMTLQS